MRCNGRPKSRWKDEVLNDIKKIIVKHWAYLGKDRKASYGLVHKAKTHKGS
jgi:hypothetical protein